MTMDVKEAGAVHRTRSRGVSGVTTSTTAKSGATSLLTSDLLMKSIYSYVAKVGYAASVADTRWYDTVRTTISADTYEHLRRNKYIAKENSLSSLASSTQPPRPNSPLKSQSLERAFDEVKTLRMASNGPLRRVREAVIAAIFDRVTLMPGDAAAQRTELTR
ncbi:hypothetical protein OH76DRAFT_1422031 [Lentinus brumalis]|uniref:Uncharacterized protein n=1 Tax=Lentinus brumalis TaxID=2498619 RepID=A0A371CSQ2_9APHY|nr:hypothetical protein OH76DRAFT_1422031 [Polyporus brumalis]